MTRIHEVLGENSKVYFKNTSSSTLKNPRSFEFPPTVARILDIFQYVVADIILCLKNSSSAETLRFWSRTSSQCDTLALVGSRTQNMAKKVF